MSLQKAEHTLFVGAAGTGTAYGLCWSARQHFGDRIRIVVADTNPRHLVAASALSDAFEQLPPVASGEFPAALGAALRRHRVDTYQPILDEEIVLAAEMARDGRIPASVSVLAPSPEVAALCFDKFETARRLRAAGLPSPDTDLIADVAWREEGLVVKPRFGRGSLGVDFLKTVADLNAVRMRSELVAQEKCAPPELTIDTFRSRRGNLFRAICRERIEVKAGVCTKARVFEDEELSSMARHLCDALGLTGTICFQVMRRSDGSWAITDVNPRPGAGTRMSAAAGVDVLLAALLDAWGDDPLPAIPRLTGERFVVRSFHENVFDAPR